MPLVQQVVMGVLIAESEHTNNHRTKYTCSFCILMPDESCCQEEELGMKKVYVKEEVCIGCWTSVLVCVLVPYGEI